jgi:thiol-disulfide isomerase/thioredoxin
MNTVRIFVILWVISSLSGCGILTGRGDDYTTETDPTVAPLASAESSPSTSPEEVSTVPSAPSALPEQSRVYESDAVKTDPTLKSGSTSDGWSVPADPSPSEVLRNPTPNLQPSDAQPDLGIVKSSIQSSISDSGNIVGDEISRSLKDTKSSVDQGLSSSRSLIEDPFAPVKTSSEGINLKSTFPELGATQPSASQLQVAASTPPPATSVPGTVRGGQPAPTFAVTTLDGSSFDLSSQKGKVVVLDFWRKTCTPCLKAMPRLAEIRSSFPEGKLMILGMNTDETKAEAESFLRTHPHHWPNVHVLSQRTNVLSPYGIRLLPTFVVIDQVGTIQYRGNDVNQAASKVSELVANPSIPNANYMAALR